MNMKSAFAMLMAAGALSSPVRAEETTVEPDMERFRSMVKPADVDMFFNYLREAMKAGMEGKVPPTPPALLSQRAQELAQSLKQQGATTMDQLLQQIQQEMKKSLPPASPSDAPKENPSNRPDYRT